MKSGTSAHADGPSPRDRRRPGRRTVSGDNPFNPACSSLRLLDARYVLRVSLRVSNSCQGFVNSSLLSDPESHTGRYVSFLRIVSTFFPRRILSYSRRRRSMIRSHVVVPQLVLSAGPMSRLAIMVPLRAPGLTPVISLLLALARAADNPVGSVRFWEGGVRNRSLLLEN